MRRIRHVVGLALVALACFGLRADAQTGTLTGAVMRDSAGHEIRGAAITVPQLGRQTFSNFLGDYIIGDLPAGTYLVVVRAVGFTPARDSVVIRDGQKVQREFILQAAPIQLDSVRVESTAPRTYISPNLQGFEERRKVGLGHFIDETELRKNDDRSLANVIVSHVPGILAMSSGRGTLLATHRTTTCGGPVFAGCKPGQAPVCYATVYIDGVLVYEMAKAPGMGAPDFGRMDVRQFAAVEYYAGGATVPVQYNATGSGCGVFLLWTRER
jgi:hypothetical protein